MIDRVLIPSAQVNAIGLVQSVRAVGFTGPVTCLHRRAKQEAIADQFPEMCDATWIDLVEPNELPEVLARRYPSEHILCLPTDERFLEVPSQPGFQNDVSSRPGGFDVIAHRQKFYAFIDDNRLSKTPRTVGSDVSPWSIFGDQFRTRVWCSWRGLVQLPKGVLIRSGHDLIRWRSHLDELGLSGLEWGYQEQLSGAPEHNLSVSGWYEPGSMAAIVTRRRGVRNQLGWWIERVDDPDNLVLETRKMLEALEFKGPFEMEFVWDPKNLCFRVIELNPRFWMQHRLLQVLTDHAPVRRALGHAASMEVKRGARHWLRTDAALSEPFRTLSLAHDAVFSHPIKTAISRTLRRKLGVGG